MKKKELLKWLIPLTALSLAYFFTRFISIRTLPPFNDEFIYVRWAQEGFFDPAMRLLSLTDGKQPLYIWLVSLMMNLVPSPMAAGRIVSILSGFLTMIGLGVFSFQIFKNRTVSFLTCFLYIVFPLAILLDRFALYDSLLAALTIWNLVAAYELIKRPNLGVSLVLALLFGGALLTKSSAILLIPMFFVMAFFSKSLTSIRYFVLSIIIAYLYQSIQYLSPSFADVSQKNSIFVYSISELTDLPVFQIFFTNFMQYFRWFIAYFGLLLLALLRKKNNIMLFFVFIVPFFIICLFGKTIYPRHIFFLTLPLLILIANGLCVKRFQYLLVVLLALPVIFIDSKILFDYKNAPLVETDRFQYIHGWPAGWGIKEITRFLQDESTRGELTILTEGQFGSMPTTAMKLYFGNFPQVHIIPINEEKLLLPNDIDWNHPVYAILNKIQETPAGWHAEELMKIQKANGDSHIRLLKLSKPVSGALYIRKFEPISKRTRNVRSGSACGLASRKKLAR